MSRSSVDRRCIAEQEKKDKAAKRPARKARDAGKAEEESVAVNLEDHKGARKLLRHAVKAVVKVKSAEIAQKLVSKAEEGDMRGAEMMLSLIEKKKKQGKEPKKKRSGPSLAELLASEPEWDENAESGGKVGTRSVTA
jgi:hypothetical protein